MQNKKRQPAKPANPPFEKVKKVLREIATEDGRRRSRVAITNELLLDKILKPDKRMLALQMLGITDFQFNPDTTVANMVDAYLHQGSNELLGLGTEVALNPQNDQASNLPVRELLLTLVREASARGQDIVRIVTC